MSRIISKLKNNKYEVTNHIYIPAQHIVFIDSQVENYQFLVNGVCENIDTVILADDRDGIKEITAFLRENSYHTVHIVSHGSPGCLYLGNTNLSLDTLNNYGSKIKTWFSPSSPSPKILLYGCNVAAGDAGEEFITKLRKLTDAEISASTTPIGNKDLGGNWNLDYQTNKVSSPLAFTNQAQNNYSGILTTFTYSDDPNPDEAIPDNETVIGLSKTFNVTDAFSIIDVNLGLSIDHTDRRDLDITLQHPDGTTIELVTDPSYFSTENLYALFDDSATTNIGRDQSDHLTPGYTNLRIPEQALSAFKGKSSVGTWTLSIKDDNSGNTGEYNDAQLILESVTAGQINGNVFLDGDGDRNDDGYHDRGLEGIIVTATDASGNDVTTTTASDGSYSIVAGSTLSGEVRLEFSLPTDGSLDHLSQINSGGVDVHFIDIDGGEVVDIGFAEPETFANDPNLRYGITCFVSGNPFHATNLDETAVASFQFSDRSGQGTLDLERGDSYISSTKIQDVGSVWGLANDRETGNLYISSALKRHSGLGPDGIGAIYLDTSTTSNDSSEVSLFYDFGALAGGDTNDTGQDVFDNDIRFPGGTTSTSSEGDPLLGSIDADVYSLVGQRGLGGMDLSEDGSQLYVTNLNDRRLYSLNTAGTTTPTEIPNAPWLDEATWDIVPENADGSESGVARPWAVKVFRDTVYVGVITDGSTSDQGNAAANDHLTAHVFAYDGTSWSSVLDSPIVLDYQREVAQHIIDGEDTDSYWHPWNNDFSTIENSITHTRDVSYSQPILGDIEFSSDGSMSLSLLDRSTFQFGYQNANPLSDSPGDTSEAIFSHGDILRVQNNNGVYNLENDGAVTDSETGNTLQGVNPVDPDGPGGRGFYLDDPFYDQAGNNLPSVGDNDVGTGGAAYNPATGEVLYGISDTFATHSAGVIAFDTGDGSPQGGIQVYRDPGLGNGGTFSKAGGLGDVELFSPTPAIEVGDRIWNDTDGNGIQDPGEAGIASVTVNLYDATGTTLLGTTTTDAEGKYLFDENNVTGSLQPNTTYQIQVDTASASLTGLNLTVPDQGSNNAIDSDALDINATPTIAFKTEDTGFNNHTLDAGFTPTTPTLPEYDYGDAPDDGGVNGDYGTVNSLSGDGAAHIITSGINIGTAPDGDSGTLQDATATADNTDNTDDEASIATFPTLESDDTSYTITNIPVTNTTGSTATLIGWIDFDGSGTFEADEATSITVPNGATSVSLDWTAIPTDIVGGDPYVRLRLSTDPNLTTSTPSGLVSDGEVEDYQLTITDLKDYGDAPDDGGTNGDYGTTSANNGASHGIIDGLAIGSVIDGDIDGQQNPTATGDNTLDGNNDEDSIASFDFLATSNQNYTVTVPVTNSTGEDATLVGWIDFDGSGAFEADEATNITVPDGVTSVDLTWDNTDVNTTNDIPTDIVGGDTFARFRLSTDPNISASTPTGELDNGEVEDYQLSITDIDYGDAPDTASGTAGGDYQTTSVDDGAAHTIVDGISIGSTVDSDLGTAQNIAADADDTDGTDDEDGVTTINSLNISDTSYSLDVDVTNTDGTATNLVGWIDFDGDGVFESSEASNIISGITSTGSQSLSWSNLNTLPDGITSGTSYIRLRLSTDALSTSDSTGLFTAGEVEDHPITIEGGTDYGDAPDDGGANGNYGTTSANGGASHGIVSGLSIGSTVDGEADGQQSSDATGDNINDTDDENSITSFNTLETDDTSYTVSVPVTNNTGGDATLIGWIDFDGSGTFESDEAVSVNAPNGTNGSLDLNWSSIPSDILDGDTFARFRLSTDTTEFDTTTPTGAADDGEVEDYQITITGVDYGDAPDPSTNTTTEDYRTTQAGDGSAHVIVDGLSLGNTVDGDNGTLQNVGATADDNSDTGSTNDEDGVAAFDPIGTGISSYSVDVAVTNTIGTDAQVIGWIDFDQNGFLSHDEVSDVITASSSGNANLTWSSIPSDIKPGDTYARFRITTDPDLEVTSDRFRTIFDDGEVEDYLINITEVDYGDAPDTGTGTSGGNYQTTSVDNGAAHTIVDGISIGNTVDHDLGTAQNAAADADGTDEDGVTTINSLNVSDTSYTLDVDVTNTDGTAANLVGWIDFDGDGVFESSEASNIISGINATGSQTLSWSNLNTLPDGITSGSSYIRLRLSTDALTANDSTGLFTGGEVEDHAILIEGGTDYGDAPDDGIDGNYGTTSANGGAFHGIVSGLSIGSTVDSETDGQQSSDATGDNTTGADDENSISFNPLETDDASYSVSVPVTNTTGGDATLIGWIDFDGNGTFEADEAISVNVPNGATSANLAWTTLPSDIVDGDTYARFRLSTDTTDFDTTTPSGAADDGEVEDYQISITPAIDYGDAPDSSISTGQGDYQTRAANDGPSHVAYPRLSIGSSIDGDNGLLENVEANADDTDGVADENGVTFSATPLKTNTTSYSVDVEINNDAGADVNLVGWIDFDQSGTFDSDEAVTLSGAFADGSTQTLTWSGAAIPNDIVEGDTYGRFRLSTDALTVDDSLGAATDGEVEDYQISIAGVDYGDAPDPASGTATGDYETTAANGGASHEIVSILSIGSSVDSETGTLQNTAADADDTANADDEDGVTFTETLETSDASYSANVDVNLPKSDATFTDDFSSGYATNSAQWSGDWTELRESNGSGSGDLVVTSGRLRIQDDDTSIYRQIDLSGATGDATLSFNYSQSGLFSIQTFDIIVSDSLGGTQQTVFSIDNSTPNSTAAGEFASVTIPQSLLTSTTTISIQAGSGFYSTFDDAYIDNIEITAPVGADIPATLVSWVDFNRDGTFDSTEGISQTVNNSGTETVTWNGIQTLPGGIVAGDTYAHFRLSTDSGLTTSTPNGSLPDGEVEDYKVNIASGIYKISGSVLDDTNINATIDNPGDTPISGVTVTLFDATNLTTPYAVTTTDTSGFYEFTGLDNGDYVVVQTQPGDYDSVTDIDDTDDNQIAVTIADADVTGRDFLEETPRDYGDAPDTGSGTGSGNYETTAANGGASHSITSGLSIGAEVDADDGTLQNTDANADDNDGTPDDEDGVSLNPLATDASSYSVDVDVTNTTGGNVTLAGWIDFDGDGVFGTDEEAIATVADGETTATLNWSTIPGDIAPGDTYARFRISSDALTESDATGPATDGEVEDYKINITEITEPPTIDLDGDDSVLTGTDFETSFLVGGAPVAIADDILIGDPDDDNLQSASIYLKTRPDGDAAESLEINGTLPDGISASAFDPVTGIITLTGDASIEDYEIAIAQVEYTNTIGWHAGDRLIEVTVNDGLFDSNTALTTLNLDYPPAIDLDGDNSSFV